jgi:hypothetical protein
MAGQELAGCVSTTEKYGWSHGSIGLASPIAVSSAPGQSGKRTAKGSNGEGSLGGRSFSSDIRGSDNIGL